MACKSAIYAANTAAQALSVGSTINFGNLVRRFGPNLDLSGGNITVSGAGYYDLTANFTLTAGAAGTAVITLYKGGIAIPGAVATMTVADDSVYAVSIPAILRQTCCCDTEVTAILTGVAATINNAAIAVEKI